jgi:hypothetical protein
MVLASRTGTGAAAVMTVQIIDLQGKVVARAAFTPQATPYIPGCGSVVQPAVRVAAGAVFYANSGGVVRRLNTNGTVTQVATFKLTSPQQFLSYAVSPDGKQLLATIFSTPPLLSPVPEFPTDPYVAGGHWTLDLESAPVGGSTTLVLHSDLGTKDPSTGPTEITGWDDFGPTATLDTTLCVQQSPPSLEYTGTALIHVGPDGAHLDRIGGASCIPMDELLDGTVLCGAAGDVSFSVRRRNGDLVWGRQPGCCLSEPKVAPDGAGVEANDQGVVVYLRAVSKLPSAATSGSVTALGWVGPQMLAVIRQNGEMGLASAASPQSFTDLGLTIANLCLSCVPVSVLLAGTIGIA